MARKTVKVADLRTTVNRMIASTDAANVQGRQALCVLIQSITMDADDYHGFRFLPGDEMDGRRHYHGPEGRDIGGIDRG